MLKTLLVLMMGALLVLIVGFSDPVNCTVVWEDEPFVVGKGGCPSGSFGVGIKNLSQGLCVNARAVCE